MIACLCCVKKLCFESFEIRDETQDQSSKENPNTYEDSKRSQQRRRHLHHPTGQRQRSRRPRQTNILYMEKMKIILSDETKFQEVKNIDHTLYTVN